LGLVNRLLSALLSALWQYLQCTLTHHVLLDITLQRWTF